MNDYEKRMKSLRHRKGEPFFRKLAKTMMAMAVASEQAKIEEEARKQILVDEAIERMKAKK